MAHKHLTRLSLIGPREAIVLMVCALLALLAMSFNMNTRAPITSSETRFTETSASGMQIVPASCPSDPHYEGECSTTTGPICPTAQHYAEGTGCVCDSNNQVAVNGSCNNPTSNNGCSISASPSALSGNGQSSTLSWSVQNRSFLEGSPSNITLTSVGTVQPSGSATVTPTQTTVYTLSGEYTLAGLALSTFSCGTVVTLGASCPAGQAMQGGQCVVMCPTGQHAVGYVCICDDTGYPADVYGQCTAQICQNGFQYDPGSGQCIAIQQCSLPVTCSDNTHVFNQCTGVTTNCSNYGTGWECVSGSCQAPPPPTANLQVVPSLVVPSGTATVSWTSANATSCTVTGNNGDGSWSGTNSSHATSPIVSQVIYTLSCTGRGGDVVTDTATVNIIPNWVEN
jgi:hypothetical protein